MKRIHVVRRGEYLDQIALDLGVSAAAIWSAADNKDLRAQRANPNMLAPGDLLAIPPKPSAETLAVTAGETNRYRVTVPRVKVSFVATRRDGAYAGQRWVVQDLPAPIEGVTDGDGTVEFEVPIGVAEVRVLFPDLGRAFRVRVGGLDPIDGGGGLGQRLAHLGYGPIRAPGAGLRLPRDPDPSAQALRAFQLDQGLGVNGVPDEATLAALEAEHLV